MSGIQLKSAKAAGSAAVVASRGQEADKVAALDGGADDYLTKPFGTAELLARVRVALRHGARTDGAESAVQLGDVRVDLQSRQVFRGAAELHLTALEWKLSAAIVQHAGKVVTHRQLLRAVWGPNCVEQTHYLRVYMAQLRAKLEADPE